MEETQVVSISYWKNCPFRGLPHVELDDRCPSSLHCIVLPVEITEKASELSEPRPRGRPRKDEVREIPIKEVYAETHFIPMLESGSYCSTCTNDHIREKELGRSFAAPRILTKKGKK